MMARYVDRADRDAIHGVVCDDLRYCAAISVAIERRDFGIAQVLASRCRVQLALLDDLGWHPDDDRDQFQLTLSDDQLAQVLMRLLNAITLVALDQPDREQDPDPEIRATYQRDHRVAAICNTILRQLPPASVSGAVEPLPGDVPPED